MGICVIVFVLSVSYRGLRAGLSIWFPVVVGVISKSQTHFRLRCFSGVNVIEVHMPVLNRLCHWEWFHKACFPVGLSLLLPACCIMCLPPSPLLPWNQAIFRWILQTCSRHLCTIDSANSGRPGSNTNFFWAMYPNHPWDWNSYIHWCNYYDPSM